MQPSLPTTVGDRFLPKQKCVMFHDFKYLTAETAYISSLICWAFERDSGVLRPYPLLFETALNSIPCFSGNVSPRNTDVTGQGAALADLLSIQFGVRFGWSFVLSLPKRHGPSADMGGGGRASDPLLVSRLLIISSSSIRGCAQRSDVVFIYCSGLD